MTDAFDFAINLAFQSGELLQNYYTPNGIHSRTKADHTLVTDADLAVDAFIEKQIKVQFPQDAILSEESSYFLKNPQIPTWVIDPLDGTTNFSLGLAVWGVSIARVVNGYPDLGVIYFPRLGELYSARSGAGALLNNELIKVKAPDPSQPNSFFACCSRSFRTFDIRVPYKPRIMGSSSYTFSMVARGSALLGLDVSAKIWDIAAVWLLVQEAGGIIDSFEGIIPFPLSADIDYSKTSYITIAAATPKLLEMAHAKIQLK